MNILEIVTRSELGGAQSVVASLASEFHARGHEVAVASGPEGEGAAWRGLDSGIDIYEIEGLIRAVSPREELKALRGISRLYRGWQPDIVHLHTSKAGLLGRLAPGVKRRRIVYTMHGYFQLKDINRKFLAADKAARHLCGAVVAVSENDRRLMSADGYAARCVPNGVPDQLADFPHDPAVVARLEALKSRGLPLVMVVARDASFKRIDLAREAARRLEGKAMIVWIGGEPLPSLDPPAFLALGTVPHASAYLRFADIYLQPSNHEGLSMSLLEAFSAGLPCVASSVGGNIETLGLGPDSMRSDGSEGARETDYGILVPNEAGEMGAALSRLAADPGQRARMGAAARRAWERKYSSSAMAESYLSLYGELIRG